MGSSEADDTSSSDDSGSSATADVQHLEHTLLVSAFVLLGAGILFPWNSWITAVDYFSAAHPHASIDRLFSVFYMIPSLVGLAPVMQFADRLPSLVRIEAGLLAYVACLLVVPVGDALTGNVSLPATLVAVCVTGLADAVVQGSLYGFAAPLPAKYTQALTAGASISGLVASGLRIMTKAALPETFVGMRCSAHFYFICSTAVVVACIAVHRLVIGSRLYRHYTTAASSDFSTNPPLNGVRCAMPDEQITTGETQEGASSSCALLRRIWACATAVAGVYVVTLAIFPGAVTEDVSSQVLGSWYPILLITLFNVGDVVGKAAPGQSFFLPVPADKALLACVAARVLFIPLFAMCAAWRASPLIMGTFTFALGVSNGYCSAAAFMRAPQLLPVREKEAGGIIMVVALLVGLTLGACAGWLWLLI